MSQAKAAAFAVVALIVGLVIGLFIPFGEVAPTPITETKTATAQLTVTAPGGVETETAVVATTLTQVITQTGKEAVTVTETKPQTVTQTKTVEKVTTETQLGTVTITRLGTGKTLVTFSGSADAKSPPFTATTPMVKVTLQVTSQAIDIRNVGVAWYLYKVGDVASTDHAGIDGEEGTFEFYGYGLTVGRTYYVEVLSANCRWSVTVEET